MPACRATAALHAIHAQLRTRTAAVHAALDARFRDGLLGPGRYAAYLLGMHRTVTAFESTPAPPTAPDTPARSGLLQADLDALGLAPLAPAPLAFASAAHWHGAHYVIEGSALGAGMLLATLRGHALPLAFLQSHGHPGARWRAVLAGLECFSDTEVPALCEGALSMFAVAEDSFARADRRL